MTAIEIPYKPRDYQNKALHNVNARFKVLVRHRGSGKTTAGLAELLKAACLKKGTYHFISPTYTQSKRNAWKIIKEMAVVIPGTNFNESELKITIPNGSVMYLLGADNPDSLRGLDFTGVIFDEYSQQPSNVFTEIVRPRLAINEGRAIWIGTPKGQNSFYELYEQADKEGRHRSMLRYTDTNIIKEAEVETLRNDMSTDEFEQELNCSFTASIKGAYYGKDISIAREEGRICKGVYDPALPVNTYWDLGISDHTPIVFVQFHNNEIRIIDAYHNNNEALPHYFKIVSDKPYSYEYHYFPHDITVRDLGTGVSRLELAHKHFGSNKCRITPNISVKDGIDAVRYLFNKMWFDEDNTKGLLDALSQYSQQRDDKMGMFKDRPRHDWTSHYADAIRYLAVNYRDVQRTSNRDHVITVDFSKQL